MPSQLLPSCFFIPELCSHFLSLYPFLLFQQCTRMRSHDGTWHHHRPATLPLTNLCLKKNILAGWRRGAGDLFSSLLFLSVFLVASEFMAYYFPHCDITHKQQKSLSQPGCCSFSTRKDDFFN